VHLNNSRDEFNSGRDRHANVKKGNDRPEVLVAVLAAADAPAVVETPAEGQAEDIAYLMSRSELSSVTSVRVGRPGGRCVIGDGGRRCPGPPVPSGP